MPIYEYACEQCHETFEELHLAGGSNKPPACPHCGSAQVRRKVSAAGFVLKGSGWYLTDYARKGERGSKGKSSKSGESASSSDGADGSGTSSQPASSSQRDAA